MHYCHLLAREIGKSMMKLFKKLLKWSSITTGSFGVLFLCWLSLESHQIIYDNITAPMAKHKEEWWAAKNSNDALRDARGHGWMTPVSDMLKITIYPKAARDEITALQTELNAGSKE